jgi:hypothetical protein
VAEFFYFEEPGYHEPLEVWEAHLERLRTSLGQDEEMRAFSVARAERHIADIKSGDFLTPEQWAAQAD